MRFKYYLLAGVVLILHSCNLKTQSKNMQDLSAKNFSCDIETKICKPTDASSIEEIILDQSEKVKLVYYTDPICSACWAIEPQLKKFKLEYGDYVNIEYKMGGLLPGWEGFADKSNGISKPSDVAHHWDEVGQHTGMSIDGDIWLEDPLSSSFPPSIAFKAVQKQGEELALQFLRNIREKLFLEKKNITKEHFLLKAIEECGGNTFQFLEDYHSESTKKSFYKEMNQGKDLGVRGFPTFIFIGKERKGFKISGMSGYDNYILALEKAYGKKLSAKAIHYTELELLEKYRFLSTKEIAFILSQDLDDTTEHLTQLVGSGKVTLEKQKYSDFWRIVNSDSH